MPIASFLNEPYSTFSKRLSDWLNAAGGEITDLTLDLLNRSQGRLWAYRAWDDLIQYGTLTLVSNATSTFPADFGGIICRIGSDTNADGKIDVYYYKDAPVGAGYKIVTNFAKATGYTWTITFYNAPTTNPTIVYPKLLDDFTGTGTEYSFFPPELLIAKAQEIHIQEADLVGNEYQTIVNKAAELLRDYEQAHQYQNIEMRVRQLDDSGVEIGNENYDLTSGSDATQEINYDNDQDLG